jgi:uracil-DNA glycosylase family 4
MSEHDVDHTAPDISFVPQLDARQRAMLAEMGVRVWAPLPAAASVVIEADRPSAKALPPTTEQPVARVAATVARTVDTPEQRQPKPVAPSAQRPVPSAATRHTAPEPSAPANALWAPPAEGITEMDWSQLETAVTGCRACGLCESRRHTVFGAGSTAADWMVVGEAPGENEDREGLPFVGASGELLDNMLRAVGRSRSGSGAQGAYIANVLKCRPPSNRNPQPAEIAQCAPYLARQVALLQPKIILAMGRFAVQSLLQTNEPIGKLRGRVHHYQGVPVIVTYHPAYLLRTPTDKAKAWADLCLALETAGSPPQAG